MTLNKQKYSESIYLSRNISYLLDLFNLDIKNLSVLTGVPAPSISRLKKAGANPTVSTLGPIADFFKVELESLLYEDLSGSEYKKKSMLGKVVYVPVFPEGSVSGELVAQEFIGVTGVYTDKAFGVKVTSKSLGPIFQDGTIVILEPDLDANEGDYVFCKLDGEETPVFRQVFFDGKRVFFKALNPLFGDITCPGTYNILGVVIKSVECFR